MKNRTLPILLAIAALMPGCATPNPQTGLPEFDAGKTEAVKLAVAPFVGAAVYDVLGNSPQHKAELGEYFRAFGTIFKRMKTEGAFTPDFLLAEADKVTARFQGKLPTLAIAAKNSALAIYRICWDARFRADLSPEKWPVHVADVLSTSIDQALKDSALPGL
jgi:hypothetical protein